ncbi:hypothetical protein [Hymenobacter sp. B81]|uniref:hypothetical protein n=1 Tax=Hymenobacter sp. B81 TaxID=3344878 RepID=UPI0037DC71F1
MEPISPAILDAAISRGLDYLQQHQYPNGEFCVYCAADAPMLGWTLPDSAIFPTALIAGSLLHLADDPRADAMLALSTDFFQYQMAHGGLWNHFTLLHRWRYLCPLDVDDTCCISAVLRARGLGWPPPGNEPLLLANRTRQGLFYSWFLLRPRWNANRTYWRVTLPELLRPLQSIKFWYGVEANRNDVDGVVNANALYYLGERPETQPIIDFLLRIIAEGREADCDLWYRDAPIVYYFFARTYPLCPTRLEPLRQPIIDRICAAAKPDGRLGETVVDTALSVCALLSLQAAPPELAGAVAFLLQTQERPGHWPRWLVYYGGPKKRMGWGSEEITTAFCLEALARYRAAQAGG